LTPFIHPYLPALSPMSLGCSAQTCFLNSSSQRRTKSCFISSNETPAGSPEARNNHAHREHPGAREFVSLIHNNMRPATLGIPGKTL
jgi:hypothetical protein